MMPVGALAAGAIGRRLGVPKVTRLFGATIAGVSRREYLRNLWEVAALKTPADLFVLVDDGSFADVVAQRLGVPPDRLHHIMNGVEPESFAEVAPADRERVGRELSIQPSTAVFLLAHQFLPWHNQRAFIEAMAAVIRRGADAVGLLAGDGPER